MGNIINPYRFGTGLKEGLLHCWEFDETAGSTAYDSHGSNNGTVTGATINQTGKLDKSYLFNGDTSTDRVDSFSLPSIFDTYFTNDFSVSLWMNASALGSYDRIFGVHVEALHNFQIGIDNQNHIMVHIYYGGTQYYLETNYVPTTGSWYNVISTWDKSLSALKLYVNNTDETTVSAAGFSLHTGGLIVGNRPSTFDRCFDGYIDQIAIWDRILTTAERSNVYNSAIGIAYSNW